jgi:hypothetical protein
MLLYGGHKRPNVEQGNGTIFVYALQEWRLESRQDIQLLNQPGTTFHQVDGTGGMPRQDTQNGGIPVRAGPGMLEYLMVVVMYTLMIFLSMERLT